MELTHSVSVGGDLSFAGSYGQKVIPNFGAVPISSINSWKHPCFPKAKVCVCQNVCEASDELLGCA